MSDEFKNLVVVAVIGWLLWHFFGKKACCAACARGTSKQQQPGQQSHPRAVESRPPKQQPCGCGPYAAYGR